MKAPSGLRRTVMFATFTAMAALALTLWILEDQIAEEQSLLMAGGLVAMVVGVLLTWGLTRTLVHPARELTKVADALATGNLAARTRSSRRDELGDIGRALDRLAEQLTERQATLRAQEDRLTTMLDSMAEGVFVTDEQGMIDLTNDALDAMVELEPLGRTIIEVIRDVDLETHGLGRPPVRIDRLNAEFLAEDDGWFRLRGNGEPSGEGSLEWNVRVSPQELRGEGHANFEGISLALVAPLLPNLPWYEADRARLSGHLQLAAAGARSSRDSTGIRLRLIRCSRWP